MANGNEPLVDRPSNEQRDAVYPEGHIYGGDDLSDKVLFHLVVNDVITLDEAKRIVDVSDPGDSLNMLLGYVVGVLKKAPREVAKGLEGSGINITASEIDAMDVPGSERLEDVEEFANRWANPIRRIQHTIDDLITGVADVSLFGEDQPAGWGARHGFEEPRDSVELMVAKRDAEEDILAAIKQMEAEGGITEDKAKKLVRITEGERSNRLQEVYDELWDVGTVEEQEALRAEFASQSDILPEADKSAIEEREAIKRRYVNYVDPNTVDTLTAPERQQVDPTDLITGQYVPADPDYYGSFYSQIEDIVTDAVDMPEPRKRATYFGDHIYDPSTGQSYSEEEWDFIMTTEQGRTAYIASKQVAPAVAEILSQPHFSQQIQFEERSINVRNPDGSWTSETIPMQTDMPGSGDLYGPGPIQIPMEDLGIPSPAPTNPWETRTFNYREGDGYGQWMAMTSRERQANVDLMHSYGLITDEQYEVVGGAFDMVGMAIYEQATSLSAEMQWSPGQAIMQLGKKKMAMEAPTRRYGGGAASAPKYSVPASMRTIPDYKALSQESRGIFRQKVGRDLEDWELSILSDQLKDDYTTMNDQMIVAHRAAWEDAVAGGSTEVDYSDVTRPTASLEYDIEERYAGELDRQERVEDRAANRRILMDSISVGQRMIQ